MGEWLDKERIMEKRRQSSNSVKFKRTSECSCDSPPVFMNIFICSNVYFLAGPPYTVAEKAGGTAERGRGSHLAAHQTAGCWDALTPGETRLGQVLPNLPPPLTTWQFSFPLPKFLALHRDGSFGDLNLPELCILDNRCNLFVAMCRRVSCYMLGSQTSSLSFLSPEMYNCGFHCQLY